MSNVKTVTVNNGTGTFKLEKDQKGYTSYWVCTGGQCPGVFGQNQTGMIVPIAFRDDLYTLAREAGYTPEDLASPKRPEKVKASGTGGRPKKAVTKRGIRVGLKSNLRSRLKSRVKVAPASTDEN